MNFSHQQLHLESLIPIINPKWKRTVVSRTEEPTLRLSRAVRTSEQKGVTNDVECRVCAVDETTIATRTTFAKYACPRCSIPYCSVTCYQNHSQNCTESFYRSRVTQEMRLHRQMVDMSKGDDADSIHAILQRVHDQQQELYNPHLHEVDNNPDPNDHNTSSSLTKELEQLREALDCNEDVQLSPELQLAFERDVHAGKLSHVVQPWHPWWRASLLVVPADQGEDNAESISRSRDNKSDVMDSKDLDARILRIPSFSQLSRKPANSFPSHHLVLNLISITYSIAYTILQFGGPVQASCLEGAETIVLMSPVLSHDKRFDSLPELLLSLQQLQQGQQYCYLDDVLELLSNRRHLAHALLNGIDVLKAGGRECMPATTTSVSSRSKLEFKRWRKKLEFYLSWSREFLQENDLQHIVCEIRNWRGEWTLDPHNDHINTLKLSSLGN